jgi:hypothetical protein
MEPHAVSKSMVLLQALGEEPKTLEESFPSATLEEELPEKRLTGKSCNTLKFHHQINVSNMVFRFYFLRIN